MNRMRFASTALVMTLSLTPLLGPSADAAQYDLKQLTPTIQKALDGRKARYDELRKLKSQGAVGEDNQGFVKALAAEPTAQQVVQAENTDLQVIYQAIVEQHELGPQGLGAVKIAFAEVQREKAQAGDRIQLPSGEWTTK